MNSRTVSVIAVVALVVLAGCSGLVPGGNSAGNGTTATQTTHSAATDAPTQTTSTATGEAPTTISTAGPTAASTTGTTQMATTTGTTQTTATGTTQTTATGTTQTATQATTENGTQSGMFPPGYGASGITNPQRALEAHRTGLSASDSYTLTLTINTTEREFILVRQVNITNKRMYSILNATLRSGFGVTIATYQNGTTRYTKTDVPLLNKSRYNVTHQLFRFTGSNKSIGRAVILRNVSYGDAERVTHNGTTLLRYESTEVLDAKSFLPLLATNATVNKFNATILVTKEGVIQSLSYSITYTTASGEQKTRTITTRLSRIGTTSVEAPAWLDEAKAQTDLSTTGPGTNATTASS